MNTFSLEADAAHANPAAETDDETPTFPIDRPTRRALEVLGAAVGLGLAGDLLLRATPWGFNACLWLIACAGVALGLAARWRAPLAGTARWTILPLLAAAVLFLARDAVVLRWVTTGLALGSLAFAGRRSQKTEAPGAAPGLAAALLGVLVALPKMVRSDIDWRSSELRDRLQVLGAGLRGLAIATPALLVFGVLLAGADDVFDAWIRRLTDLHIAALPGHLVGIGLSGWMAGGLLGRVLADHPEPSDENEGVKGPCRIPSLGLVEVSVVLGLVNALFGAFVLLQLSYLFGGAGLVEARPDLTLAAYARRGFFELVAVAALALPFLCGLNRVTDLKRAGHRRVFNGLAGVQVGLLALLLASAALRMGLYLQGYGLTELRFYTSAFMVWLAVLLVWFTATVLRGRPERFMPGAWAAAFALVVLLHGVNPDALIARVNLERAREGKPFDVVYAASLSADAVPTLLAGQEALRPADRFDLARRLLARWGRVPTGDWRSWNPSQARARRLVLARMEQAWLDEEGGGPWR